MTPAEYSRYRKVKGLPGGSRAAVSYAIAQKRITLQADGRLDPVAADAQWAANTRVRIGAGPAPAQPGASASTAGQQDPQPGGDDYWNSRSRREAAEAELAEIELAEKTGQVIQVKVVEAVWGQALGATREHLLQLRARLAPLLAAEADAFKIEQLLDVEMSQALSHMARVRLNEARPA
jgi:hypothetical protein